MSNHKLRAYAHPEAVAWWQVSGKEQQLAVELEHGGVEESGKLPLVADEQRRTLCGRLVLIWGRGMRRGAREGGSTVAPLLRERDSKRGIEDRRAGAHRTSTAAGRKLRNPNKRSGEVVWSERESLAGKRRGGQA